MEQSSYFKKNGNGVQHALLSPLRVKKEDGESFAGGGILKQDCQEKEKPLEYL